MTASRACRCGCGETTPPSRTKPRLYVNETHRKRYQRARSSAQAVQLGHALQLAELLEIPGHGSPRDSGTSLDLKRDSGRVPYVVRADPSTSMTGTPVTGEVVKSTGSSHEATGADPTADNVATQYVGNPSGISPTPPAEPSMWLDWTTPDPTNDSKEI